MSFAWPTHGLVEPTFLGAQQRRCCRRDGGGLPGDFGKHVCEIVVGWLMVMGFSFLSWEVFRNISKLLPLLLFSSKGRVISTAFSKPKTSHPLAKASKEEGRQPCRFCFILKKTRKGTRLSASASLRLSTKRVHNSSYRRQNDRPKTLDDGVKPKLLFAIPTHFFP